MKIPFSDITAGGIHRYVKDTGWSNASGVESIRPAEAEIEIQLSDDITAQLEGRLHGAIRAICSRCGESTDYDIAETFKYIFRVGEDSAFFQKEVELTEQDSETVFLDEAEIDIDEILAEQFVLAVPEKVLCSQTCRGLCPHCGISFNEETCNCADEHSNSPFAVLKKLKK